MEKMIHVSVIIPAHNEEKYVKRCIASIRRSACAFKGNVEIIVVCNRCRTTDSAVLVLTTNFGLDVKALLEWNVETSGDVSFCCSSVCVGCI